MAARSAWRSHPPEGFRASEPAAALRGGAKQQQQTTTPCYLFHRLAAVSVEGSWLRAFLQGGARMSENPFSGQRRLLHTHLACVILFV